MYCTRCSWVLKLFAELLSIFSCCELRQLPEITLVRSVGKCGKVLSVSFFSGFFFLFFASLLILSKYVLFSSCLSFSHSCYKQAPILYLLFECLLGGHSTP